MCRVKTLICLCCRTLAALSLLFFTADVLTCLAGKDRGVPRNIIKDLALFRCIQLLRRDMHSTWRQPYEYGRPLLPKVEVIRINFISISVCKQQIKYVKTKNRKLN